MPFALKTAAAVEDFINFDNQSNVKLHRRAITQLEDKLYNFVPHNLFNFLDFLNNGATKLQWSNNVGIIIIL